MIAASALMCLALNTYHEARSETIPGQYAVASVAFNRAEQDPKRVCDVVFQPKQFSWANSGVKKTSKGWAISKRLQPKDEDAWLKAIAVARQILRGVPDITRGATHYHTVAVKPYWTTRKASIKTIGRHIFYQIT